MVESVTERRFKGDGSRMDSVDKGLLDPKGDSRDGKWARRLKS